MPDAFPGAGHKYLVDFQSSKLTLSFMSDTSLTYVASRCSRNGWIRA